MREDESAKRPIIDTVGDDDTSSRVLMVQRRGMLVDEVTNTHAGMSAQIIIRK